MHLNKLEKKILLERYYNKYYIRFTYFNLFSIIDNGTINFINSKTKKEGQYLYLKKYIKTNQIFINKKIEDYIINNHIKQIHLYNKLNLLNSSPIFRKDFQLISIFKSTYVGVIGTVIYRCTRKHFRKNIEKLSEEYFSKKKNLIAKSKEKFNFDRFIELFLLGKKKIFLFFKGKKRRFYLKRWKIKKLRNKRKENKKRKIIFYHFLTLKQFKKYFGARRKYKKRYYFIQKIKKRTRKVKRYVKKKIQKKLC